MDDPGIRRYRALLMIRYKVLNNATNKTIAREFKVAEKTVDKTMSWARKANVLAKLEDRLLDELGPLAIETLKGAMTGPDASPTVALEVLNKMIFKTNKSAQADPVSNELERYVNQLRGGSEPTALEGEIVRSELPEPAEVRSLPPHEADGGSDSGEGNDTPAPEGSF
jgi:hypothetical protein